MGLLDDAIREHLELKRRGGADATDIARMERDALGPVVRAEEQPAAETPAEGHDEPVAETAVEQPVYAEPEVGYAEAEPDYAEPEPAYEAPEPAPEPEPVQAAEPEPEPEFDAGATQEYDVEAVAALLDAQTPAESEVHDERHEPVEAEPEPEAAAPPPPPAPPAPAPPEHPAAPEGEAADDDVLEQTPDFLQETPEHDRLWFEQGPPQEFDFDK